MEDFSLHFGANATANVNANANVNVNAEGKETIAENGNNVHGDDDDDWTKEGGVLYAGEDIASCGHDYTEDNNARINHQ